SRPVCTGRGTHPGRDESPVGSRSELVPQDAPQAPDRILPADLLALRVGATAVRDGHFEDPTLEGRDLVRHLRPKAESILFQDQPLQDRSPKGLIAGPHVREIQVRQHVRDDGEHLVRHGMPIEQDAMGTAEEARPIDDIRNPALNGRDELEVVLRLILEIRSLDDDDVTAGFLKSSPERGSLSTVRWLKIDLQVVVPGPSGSKSM